MPDLIRRMLGDLESEHPDQEGTGKSEKKLKPEEYKALLLLIADGLKKSAEDCVIDSMMVDMENKVVPVYDYGKREPVRIESRGFRYVIDVDYLKPKEGST